MNAVKDQVTNLVEIELAAANEKYPAFHSAHEGYAVILEEVEEAKEYMDTVMASMEFVWSGTRRDLCFVEEVEHIKNTAERLACEAIQVAAMAQKYLDMEGK